MWFDAFVTNIDRTARNANLLWWHKQSYFIPITAPRCSSITTGRDIDQMAVKPFLAIAGHILLPWAGRIAEVDSEMRARLTAPALTEIVDAVPPEWLPQGEGPSPHGYLTYFRERLAKSRFVEEAVRAHAQLV